MSPSRSQKQQYASLTVLGFAAALAVILRLVARAKSKAKYGADDGLAVGALVLFLAYVSLSIWGMLEPLILTSRMYTYKLG